jgi:hypothetical protein
MEMLLDMIFLMFVATYNLKRGNSEYGYVMATLNQWIREILSTITRRQSG